MSSKPDTQPDRVSAVEGGAQLSRLEVEVIDLFVNAVKVFGIPKSVGEIYGLLFVAPEPVALDVLVERLRISKGSASQGLRFLRNLGAVKTVYVAGSRRDHFTAETELRRLVSGFIKGEMQPHLENGEVRLERLDDLAREAAGGANGAFYGERVRELGKWQKQARKILPLVEKILN